MTVVDALPYLRWYIMFKLLLQQNPRTIHDS